MITWHLCVGDCIHWGEVSAGSEGSSSRWQTVWQCDREAARGRERQVERGRHRLTAAAWKRINLFFVYIILARCLLVPVCVRACVCVRASVYVCVSLCVSQQHPPAAFFKSGNCWTAKRKFGSSFVSVTSHCTAPPPTPHTHTLAHSYTHTQTCVHTQFNSSGVTAGVFLYKLISLPWSRRSTKVCNKKVESKNHTHTHTRAPHKSMQQKNK